jgi:hypothetical protein
MNIIDDFSSYVWTVALKTKADASKAFQIWCNTVENQSNERLKVLITDNGELLSNDMIKWCGDRGIEHLLTAPYTSAQNGHAERLHRTLLGKARAMRFACNAPTNLWDEFVVTAAYLTNLTASSTIDGRTPHEVWFGHVPSLSHLREIGCRAFALITTNNPKIFQRSVPCVLIGYAPHSKAYRLWNPASGRVFNSFHVSFIEHLDSLPSSLLPGTFLNIDDDNIPPSWDAAGVPFSSVTLSQNKENKLLTSSTAIDPNQTVPDNTVISFPSPNVPIPSLSVSDPIMPIHTSNSPMSQNNVNNQTTTNTVTHTDNNNITPSVPPPSNVSVPTIPSPPLPRRSSRNPVPNPRYTSTSDARLNAAISDATEAGLRRKEERAARRIARLENLTKALLCDFTRDSHEVIQADLDLGDHSISVDEAIAAIADGTIVPTADSGDDPSWSEALASPDREYWIAGGRDELKSLKDLKVFVLVPRSDVPPGQRPLKGKLVCKRKRDEQGKITRYKVRYVAKGYAQRYGVDYDKTTAPTARLESFRTILHVAATLGWDIQQFDIKTAFLHGVLPDDETMFMEQPPGFEEPGKEDWVMKLLKSIYGMKQASRVWNKTFHKAVLEWGFKRISSEPCVYRRDSPEGTTIFVLHVDDIISAASSLEENQRFKEQLKSRWEISDLGPVKHALGIAVTRDLEARTVTLSQTALIDKVVEEFHQLDAHTVDTPMVAGLQLQTPDKTIPVPNTVAAWIERTPYRSLIGSLMYIAVATRPDISYAVGRLSSYLDCYRQEHWDAAIRVLRYLKGTRTLGLVLGGSNPAQLFGYSDSDYANCCCIAASPARSDDRTHTQHVSSSRTPGGADKFREKGVLHSDELTLCSSIFIKIFRGSE